MRRLLWTLELFGVLRPACFGFESESSEGGKGEREEEEEIRRNSKEKAQDTTQNQNLMPTHCSPK